MRPNVKFADRYHPATLLLLWRHGGRIRLDGTGRAYNEFEEILQPLRRPDIDDENLRSTEDAGNPESRGHHALRMALFHMREDKHPGDARVRYIAPTLYELTDKGREWLYHFLVGGPLEWLELEREESEERPGWFLWKYLHPMDGDVVCSFLCN